MELFLPRPPLQQQNLLVQLNTSRADQTLWSPPFSFNKEIVSARRRRRRRRKAAAALQEGGGKMVVELVGAFNDLTDRLNVVSTSSSRLLFKSLKLSLPLLHNLTPPPHHDPRSPLSKALSLSLLLADLQMDAEVISAGLLRQLLDAGALSIQQVKDRIGPGTAHLLHDAFRLSSLPSRLQVLDFDDDTASALRKFCLSHYDVRAVIVDLAVKLDAMRHLDHLPRYQQQLLSLQVLKIHAPLAHALGTDVLSSELEDLSFRYLFPCSYLFVDTWLRTHETEGKPLIDMCADQLRLSLSADPVLAEMAEEFSVEGRYKSRYSTMKKLLKDGRKPEQINDVLGLRVVLKPASQLLGERACYRTRQVIQSLWKEVPHRTKDYIARPKPNGYKSLHMAVDVSDNGKARPLMEIQIRTEEMDQLAIGGAASHSLYKSGLTDPEEAKRLKAIMMAAAELAALRLGDIPSAKDIEIEQRDRVFRLLDKNGDGRISVEELMEVMEELGAPGEDALEMMQLLDANSDGSLSSDEFDTFQKQVEFMRSLQDTDEGYRSMLNEKLQITDGCGLSQVHYSQA